MLMRRFMLLTALLFMSTPLMAAHHGIDHSNDLGYLLLVPRSPVKMIDSDSYGAFSR